MPNEFRVEFPHAVSGTIVAYLKEPPLVAVIFGKDSAAMKDKIIAILVRRPFDAEKVIQTAEPFLRSGSQVEIFVLGPGPPETNSDETECCLHCARMGARLFSDISRPSADAEVQALTAGQIGIRLSDADILVPI